MRNFLLRLLGVQPQVAIDIDREAIAVAKPGDTVVVMWRQLFTAQQREAIKRFRAEVLEKICPEVRFVFIEGIDEAAIVKRVIE